MPHSGAARAEERGKEPMHLTWSAPAECPSRAAVLAEVERLLGGPPERRVSAQAEVSQVGPRHWTVHLVADVDGEGGERNLDADTCASLASAAALILAWTIDPQRASAAPPAPPPPTSEPPATAPPRRTLAALAGAEVIGDVGTLPSVTVTAQAVVGFVAPWVRIEALFADWVTQQVTARVPQQPATGTTVPQGADLHYLDGGGRACFRWEVTGRLELDPCAGARWTYVSSSGFGERVRNPNGSTVWASLGGDALASFVIAGPLALRASVGFLVPMARPEFVILDYFRPPKSGDLTLYQASAAGGRATLGLEARFP